MSDMHLMAGHLIRRLNQISMSIFQERIKSAGYDLTSVQYATLDTLRQHPGIDQSTLAGLIAYDRATIGGVLDRLENKGLLQREQSAKDRRARVLNLTPKGMDLYLQLLPIVNKLQGDILAGLTQEERQHFLELAVKVAKFGNKYSRAPLAETSDSNS
ncbi:MAG: transcriptional regulator [Rhodobacteraceae bacterium]|nr:MAG: transcriptional regulator [Paracoccaceae bacterium]